MKNILLLSLCLIFINCSGSSEDTTPNEQGNLDPKLTPSENFDLSTWKLQIPIDLDGNEIGDEIKVTPLNNNYVNENHFYTAEDGGLVFKCFVKGFKTSKNTKFTRSELREMLRGTNTRIKTKGVNKNNWVFGGAPQADKNNAAAIGGNLEATLAVNHVTTTGDKKQVGRVIIGQIHANDDEPIRLYYRKLPNNSKGSIYFAHEELGGKDKYTNMIGNKNDDISNPEDGIALGEKFSYTINVTGDILKVTIVREGKENIDATVDMKNSGYNVGGQYMYFKAGVYIQDSTGNDTDFAQATFYQIKNTH